MSTFFEEVVRKGNSEIKDIFAPQTLLMPSSVGITRAKCAAIRMRSATTVWAMLTPHEKLIAIAKKAGDPYVMPTVANERRQLPDCA